jgi:hypothetical protein
MEKRTHPINAVIDAQQAAKAAASAEVEYCEQSVDTVLDYATRRWNAALSCIFNDAIKDTNRALAARRCPETFRYDRHPQPWDDIERGTLSLNDHLGLPILSLLVRVTTEGKMEVYTPAVASEYMFDLRICFRSTFNELLAELYGHGVVRN